MANLKHKLIALCLVIGITLSVSLIPTRSTPKAEALLGIGDFGFDIEDVVKFVLDQVAIDLAQRMVDDMVKETINWANTGFEGGPAYVTEPGSYFASIADSAAAGFIDGNDLNFLCSPFQNSIRLSLANDYYRPTSQRFQCSWSEAWGNIEDFYKDFDKGGWEAWYSLTQNPTSNPYGAYVEAKIELDSRIANRVGLEQREYSINQGFRSVKECLAYNPSQVEIDGYEQGLYAGEGDPGYKIATEQVPYDPTKPADSCIRQGAITSAGSTIKNGIDKILPSGLERLINADQIEDIISAFASGLLRKYVFSDTNQGLFASDSSNSYARELLDVDADGVPDGYDTDQDGELNICHHGLVNARQSASNANCIKSKNVTSSPYFIPICEKTTNVVRGLEKFRDFLDRNEFRSEHSNIWSNRTISVSGVVEDFINTISRYEITSTEFNNALLSIGKYSKDLDNVIESLAKDGDLSGKFDSDTGKRQSMIRNTNNLLRYMNTFSRQVAGKCSDPDLNALGNIPAPDIESESSTSTDTTSTSIPVSISCSPDTELVATGSEVTWTLAGNLPIGSHTFEWSTSPDAQEVNNSGVEIKVKYSTLGSKSASVNVSGTGNYSATCTGSVTVVPEGVI